MKRQAFKHDAIQSQLIQYGFAPECFFVCSAGIFVQLLTWSIAASRLESWFHINRCNKCWKTVKSWCASAHLLLIWGAQFGIALVDVPAECRWDGAHRAENVQSMSRKFYNKHLCSPVFGFLPFPSQALLHGLLLGGANGWRFHGSLTCWIKFLVLLSWLTCNLKRFRILEMGDRADAKIAENLRKYRLDSVMLDTSLLHICLALVG